MAVTVEYGKCDRCGDNNVKTATICRSCGQSLPWVKQAPVKQSPTKPAAPASSFTTHSSSPASNSSGGIAWGPMGVQLFGGVIFVGGAFLWCGNVFRFFPTVPFAGYLTMLAGSAIWKAGSNMD